MSSLARLVILSSDTIALPMLDWLAREGAGTVEIVAVFTQPDRETGRGQRVQPNGIKLWATARGLPVFQPEKLTEDVRQQLVALRPDLGLVMAYGHILRDDFIAAPRLGMLNFHTSLLPRYRGASPIQTAIASGERETGVTLMRIVRRLDAGPIADVERVNIGPLETAVEIDEKLAQACVPLLRRALPRVLAGTQEFAPQDEAQATYCRKLAKDDGALDFAAAATELAARINGLFPWPACAVEITGQIVKIGLADALPLVPAAGDVGTVLGADADGVLVATAEGTLRLRRLQRPGGKMLAAADFLRGFPLPIGTRLPSRPMTGLVERRPLK
ncbi:MAG: methionyl-tRNA formyltransferase [Opitutaceae bacterium]|nr:methionyl-tRNA formyltransferase [Opitutaceae bacterium]